MLADMVPDPTGTSCGRWRGTATMLEAVKMVSRAHQNLIWERTRHVLRLRSALREFFPAALEAFAGDLAAPDALELLARAPDPARAARLSITQITAALQAGRPPQRGGEGGADPGCPARPAARPARRSSRLPTPLPCRPAWR